jgi:hypothetical protein
MWHSDRFDKGTVSVHQIACNDASLLPSIIDNESWICGYDPETKLQSFL